MDSADRTSSLIWLALVIGNTRLHWGCFYQQRLLKAWHTPHISKEDIQQLIRDGFVSSQWHSLATEIDKLEEGNTLVCSQNLLSLADVWIASAVPAQSEVWTSLSAESSNAESPNFVRRSRIPLANLYPTLGIDRAVNLLGAGQLVGWPVVVIDAGTAITLTAGVDQAVYGGAILPGLRLQSEVLAEKTGALKRFVPRWEPEKLGRKHTLPQRWATDSKSAIASGLVYGLLAVIIDYLQDWWQTFPTGKAVLTGGDAPYLHACLKQRTPEISSRVLLDSELMFYGMNVYRQAVH